MAEAEYYQGNSNDKDIFELMLRLVYLNLRGYFRLHIIWVSEKRQIAAGVNDFSRSCLTDKIASYGSILYFVTSNETAFDRSVSLLP